MGDRSKIEWTDATWNPITGCSPVSEGCENCYAKQMEGKVPPISCRARTSLLRKYVEALYPELRAVREKGWVWKKIYTELQNVEGFRGFSLSALTKMFAAVDKEWSKKTGVPIILARRPERKRRARKAA